MLVMVKGCKSINFTMFLRVKHFMLPKVKVGRNLRNRLLNIFT